jgi:hypothetical protein
MDVFQLLIGGAAGFLVCALVAALGWLPGQRFAKLAGQRTPLEPGNGRHADGATDSFGWKWATSEPAKFWANLVVGMLSAIMFGWLIRSADSSLKQAEAQRASANDLLAYRRGIHDRFSRHFMPAVVRKYQAQVLNIWLTQNFAMQGSAELNGASWSEIYARYNALLEASLAEEDPEALCALLKGLMRTEEARSLAESLSKCVATMTSDEAMNQDKLESLRAEATEKYQRVLEEIAKEVSHDINELDKRMGVGK